MLDTLLSVFGESARYKLEHLYDWMEAMGAETDDYCLICDMLLSGWRLPDVWDFVWEYFA